MTLQREGHTSEHGEHHHITKDLFDKSKQVDILLGHNRTRCDELKRMTLSIRLEWLYGNHC